ncbi:hypothetical protein Bca101_064083 [Brassica carinata]
MSLYQVRVALVHAVSLNIDFIWLRSDCKGLIETITADQRSLELFRILVDIESFIYFSFLSFQISFIPRLFNRSAYSYIKTSIYTKFSLLGLCSH